MVEYHKALKKEIQQEFNKYISSRDIINIIDEYIAIPNMFHNDKRYSNDTFCIVVQLPVPSSYSATDYNKEIMLSIPNTTYYALLLSDARSEDGYVEYRYLLYAGDKYLDGYSYMDSYTRLIIVPKGNRHSSEILAIFYKLFAFKALHISVSGVSNRMFVNLWKITVIRNYTPDFPYIKRICCCDGNHVLEVNHWDFAGYLATFS
jgi:hypothetical protein